MRFDLFLLPPGGSPGYMVDVQSDFLSDLPSRMMIPLIAASKYKSPIKDLHPVFEIDGAAFVLLTHELASIQKRQLQRPIASLSAHRDAITRALDILFTGF
jgi:toxin CcdB